MRKLFLLVFCVLFMPACARKPEDVNKIEPRTEENCTHWHALPHGRADDVDTEICLEWHWFYRYYRLGKYKWSETMVSEYMCRTDECKGDNLPGPPATYHVHTRD